MSQICRLGFILQPNRSKIGYQSNTLYFPDRGGTTVSTLVNRCGVLEQNFNGSKTDYIASIQTDSLITLLKPGT
jgi:hypothetical protein